MSAKYQRSKMVLDQMRNFSAVEEFGNSTNNGLQSMKNSNSTDFPLDVTYVTFELFAAVLTTVGNACVIGVFAKYKAMRSVTNYYVLSLAIADLLVGMVAVPFAIVNSVGLPKLFEACLFMSALLVALCTSSIFSLVALSIDRYIAIIYPLHYKTTVTSRRSLVIIVTSWVLAILVGLLPLFGWNLGEPDPPQCIFTEVMDLTYLLFIYIATIILPSIFIAVVYSKIFWVIHMHLRNLATVNPATEGRKPVYSKSEAKAAKSLAIVVVLFVISWIPLYTINSVMYFCPDCPIPPWLLKLTIFLSHANSIWNPALYAWGLKDFRAGLKKMFCIRGSSRRDTVAAETSRKYSYSPSTISTGKDIL